MAERELNLAIRHIDLPQRMVPLPVDDRGFPVPWFVAWIDGKPDHRIADARKMPRALSDGICWTCGTPLRDDPATFVIGPMCAVNRVTSEPGNHRECATYSVQACPFLSRPHARRRRDGSFPDGTTVAGCPIERNPGVSLLWTTRAWRPFQANHGGPGVLIQLGDPLLVSWWAEGRPATRLEIDASVDSGLPALQAMAAEQDREEMRVDRMHQLSLERNVAKARRLWAHL